LFFVQRVNMRKIINIDSKIQSHCAGDVELKESAKRALMAYLRSLFLMKNKKIFKIDSIDLDKFSSSLGLISAPRIRFLQNNKKTNNIKKNKKEEDEEEDEDEESGEETEEEKEEESDVSISDLKENKLDFSKLTNNNNDDDDDEEGDSLFTIKKNSNPKSNENDEKLNEEVN
jgi:ATP-dependent RNA helicase DDX10/DBP4